MKCTQCLRPILPVVALDIDGTLGDYHSHFLDFAENWLGVKKAWSMRYDGSVDLATFMGVTKDNYRMIKLAYRQGGMKRSMPVFPGAIELSYNLKRLGVELWITTTRPYLRLDNVDPDTREWLHRNRIQYDGLIYDADKYTKLIKLVGRERICGVLEDLPHLFDQAQQEGLRPIMRLSRFNRKTRRLPGVLTLPEASVVLTRQVREWKEANIAVGTPRH